MKSACLAILNYNGVRHLQHLLPTACDAAKNYPGDCSVLVLDNCSTQPDVEWVKNFFPTVEIIIAPQNDYLFSYNWLAKQRREEILIFLNNDLKLHNNFVQPLVRHFECNDVFAVSATSRDWDDRFFTCGPARLKSHHGVYEWDYERERQECCHTLFCSGGFMAVDREKFLELGGFNRLFWPAYGEDLDLCFRAWHKKWRSIFEPASLVWHRENGSWENGEDGRVARQMFRASLFFQWASLPPCANPLERAAFMFLTALRKIRSGQGWWCKTWLAAWLDWHRIRSDFRDLKVNRQELEGISRRIAEPCQ